MTLRGRCRHHNAKIVKRGEGLPWITPEAKLVKARLSEKRWTHTKNVKKMAVKLAKRWGADPEKAAMAAILHDSAKELPKQELLQILPIML